MSNDRFDTESLADMEAFDYREMREIAAQQDGIDGRPERLQHARINKRLSRLTQIWICLQLEKPILNELKQIGVESKSLRHLPDDVGDDESVVKILCKHLELPTGTYPWETKEQIVLRLGGRAKRLKGVVEYLLEFVAEPFLHKEVRHRAGFVIQHSVKKVHVPLMKKQILIEDVGWVRVLLAHKLVEFERANVTELVADLLYLDDSMLLPETLAALGKSRDPNALNHIEKFVDSRNSAVRSEARKSKKRLSDYLKKHPDRFSPQDMSE